MTDLPFIPTADDEEPSLSVSVDDKTLKANATLPLGRRNAPLMRPFAPTSGDRDDRTADPTPNVTPTKDATSRDNARTGDPSGAPTTTPDGKANTPGKTDGDGKTAPASGPHSTVNHDAAPTPAAPKNNHQPDLVKDVNKALAGTPLDPKNLASLKNLSLDPSLLTMPISLLSTGISTLSPIASMIAMLVLARNQFGTGTPSTDSTNYPTTLGNNLNANTTTATNWDGSGKDGFSTDNSSKKNKNSAVEQIDRDLKKVLKKSGEEARIGRAKVQAILDTVNQQLTALQPISNTAAGQAQIVTLLTNAITSAGGIVSQGVNTSGVNATDVKNLANQYVSSTQTGNLTATSGNDTGGKTNQSVDEGIDYALNAHGITDPAARARWKAGYRVLVQRESGGNRFAVGDGGQAQGPTQTHWGTYSAYHVSGTPNDIHHMGSNIAASMSYVMDRYGVDKSGVNLATNVQQADPSRSPKGY